jgi:hypothetical protein
MEPWTAEDMEERWPIARAARDWMMFAASGESYGLIWPSKFGAGWRRKAR